MKLRTIVPLSGAVLVGLGPALAPSPVGAAPAAAARAADVDTEPLSCTTEALTLEEAEEGATVEITCAERPSLSRASVAGDVLMAVHYSGLGGTGSTLSIYGPADCSDVVVFGAADPWNDTIESTRPRACGNIKHFVGTGLTGENEVVSGSVTTNLTTLRNRTSSMGYGA
jgi:hypothetical protein